MVKMNRVAFAALGVLFVFALTACGTATVAWKEFTPKYAPVKVMFPGDPVEKSDDITLTDTAKTTFYSYTVQDRDTIYNFGFTTYPDGVDLISDPQEFLKSIMDGNVSSDPNNELVSSTSTTTAGGEPALDFVIKNGDLIRKERNIFSGRTLYSFSTVNLVDADYQKFVNSFTLAK